MIVSILVALIVCGVLLWAVMQLPIDPVIKNIARVVVVVLLVLWLLRVLGLWGGHLP
jgi:hypothetical protein